MTFAQFKPAVPKCWLFAVGGLMWSTVGLMLGITAIAWLVPEGWLRAVGYAGGGLILTAGLLRRQFERLAQKNIRRLRKLPAQGCFFAFQAWRSYLIIGVMIAMGATLRHLPIQRHYLAVVYTAVAGALFMGSIPYYRHLLRLIHAMRQRQVPRRPRV